jgi:RNA polymerase sigma-70 factor (ECF subfamily)
MAVRAMKEIFRESGAAASFVTSEAAGGCEVSPIEQEVMVLFEEMRRPLPGYLASFALPAADAEEVVQDYFLALFQHLQAGKFRSNLPEDAALDPELHPESQVAAEQTRKVLMAVVDALSDQDRRCLYLTEGLRYCQISEVFYLSLSTVAVSLERSLARISRATEW